MRHPGDAFQQIVGDVEYPMFVVTTSVDGEPAGCLVGFTTQCSIDPLRFLVCISKQNHTWEVSRQSSALAVHLVRDDQKEIAEHFGGVSAKDVPTKMTSWPLLDGPEGLPIIDGCDWFLGRVLERVDLGDHTGYVLEPDGGHLARDPAEQLGSQETVDIEAGQPAGSPDGVGAVRG